MDAILFSSLSSLFSLFCVRTRERSDVVFLSSRESRPPTCLKKNEKKKFLGPNRHEQKQKKTQRERERKNRHKFQKKLSFFVAARQRGVPFLISTLSKFLLSVSLSLSRRGDRPHHRLRQRGFSLSLFVRENKRERERERGLLLNFSHRTNKK